MLFWSCWSLIHTVALIVLIFLSYYSLLDHFTARLVLHLGSFLLVLVEAFLLQHLFRFVCAIIFSIYFTCVYVFGGNAFLPLNLSIQAK